MSLPKSLGQLKKCLTLYHETLTKAVVTTEKLVEKITELETNLNVVSHMITDENSENKCQICYSRTRTHCLVPCGHLVCTACTSRAQTRSRCFTCRAQIETIQRVFF